MLRQLVLRHSFHNCVILPCRRPYFYTMDNPSDIHWDAPPLDHFSTSKPARTYGRHPTPYPNRVPAYETSPDFSMRHSSPVSPGIPSPISPQGELDPRRHSRVNIGRDFRHHIQEHQRHGRGVGFTHPHHQHQVGVAATQQCFGSPQRELCDVFHC